MSNPLVSVHIITYNQISFVRETLDSALGQDYENLEVVVADDGSTDGTAEVILEYAEKYGSRLVPVVGQGNLGITGNCNRGLKHCRGKYIAFQGGDDVFYPGKITKQVQWMEASDKRVLCGHDVNVFESSTGKTIGIKRHKMPKNSGCGASSIIKYGPASFYAGTSLMVRKDAIPDYGFDTRLPIAADWKFMIDCVATSGEYGAIEGIYAGYRKHGNSITDTSMARIFLETIYSLGIMEVEYPRYLNELCAARGLVMYKLGIDLIKNGDIKGGSLYLRGAQNYTAWYSIWRRPVFYFLSKQSPESMRRIHRYFRALKKLVLRHHASY